MSASLLRVLAVAFCALACGIVVRVASKDKKAESAKSNAAQFKVPDGNPQELLEFIAKQHAYIVNEQTPRSEGATRKEKMANIQKANWAIVTAAERIVNAEVDERTAVAAVRAEVDALTMRIRSGDKDAEDAAEKLDDLTAKLKNDARLGIIRLLKLQKLRQKMERLDPSNSDAIADFVAEVKDFVRSGPPDVGSLPLVQRAMMALYKTEQLDEAAEMGQEFGKLFAESDNPEIAASSVRLIAPAGELLAMQKKSGEAVELLQKYLDDFAQRDELPFQIATIELAEAAGQTLQSDAKDRYAANLYSDVLNRLGDSKDPAVREGLEKLDALVRKLQLVGQPMPISGKLLKGGRFDPAQLKGKVVLVDFWATWCGPCLKELPNVEETYEKYHDLGFEVVGISLDDDVSTLVRFVKKRQLPWPILFEGGDETSWDHPLARRYNVETIPMAVLLNKQGKVVTLSARGEKLGELVAELLESDGARAGPKRPGST